MRIGAIAASLVVAASQLSVVPFVGHAPAARANGVAITPTTTRDDSSAAPGDVTLRSAIAVAVSTGANVHLPAVPDGAGGFLHYEVVDGPLVIGGDVAILGMGTTAFEVAVDGGGTTRVFEVKKGTVRLENLSIVNGFDGKKEGGGVFADKEARVYLTDVEVRDNAAKKGGGLHNKGIVVAERTTFAGNTAIEKGGAISNENMLTLVNATISGNTAREGGGITAEGPTHISFTTIYGNTSTGKGGGGVYSKKETVRVHNSIIVSNTLAGADSDCDNKPEFTNVIVGSLQNCAPSGTWFALDGIPAASVVRPLAYNGGKTRTHALEAGSPAIDGAVIPGFGPANCLALGQAAKKNPPPPAAIADDQRSFARDAFCDIGAFEVVAGDLIEVTATLHTSSTVVEVGAVKVPVGNLSDAILSGEPVGTPVASTPLSAIPLSAIPLSAIPLSAIKLDALPLSAIPLSAIPLSAIPLSAIPLSAIPLSAIPLSAIPLSAIPLEGTPLSAIPLSAILLSELSIGGESLEGFLAGTPLAGTPLLALNFEDLVSVPLSAIDFTTSPLSAIPLSAIPLSAIGIESLGEIIDCSLVDCATASLGEAAAPGAILGGTLGDVLGLDDVSFGSTPLSAIPLSAIALGDTPLSAIPLSAIDAGDPVATLQGWCDLLGEQICHDLGIDPKSGSSGDISIMTLALAGIPLSAIPLSAISLSAIPLSAIPLSAIPLSAIFWDSTPLSAIPLSAIPLSAIGDVVGCGGPCPAGATLGDAADSGWFLDTATIGDLDGTAFGEYSLADLLFGLLAPAEIPWQEIDVDTARLADAADPKQAPFDYIVDIDIDHPADVDVVVVVTPPDGFLFAGDLADPVDLVPVIGVDDAADPAVVEQPDGSLFLDLGTVSPRAYTLTIAMRAGVVLGDFQGSVTVRAAPAGSGWFGNMTSSSTDSTVVEAAINEPVLVGDAPELVGDVIELAHVTSSDDLDLYQFEVDGSVAGSSAQILLSNLPEDYDLVLYGPPLSAPLRGEPQQGFDAVEDFVFDLSPDDEVLDTETLQDIPHDPAQVGLDPALFALHSVSSKRGTADEEIGTGTLQAGTYFVQVSAYNGTFSDDPYLLRMRVTPGIERECPASSFSYAGGVAPPLPGGFPADLNTLFLYNHERLVAEFGPANDVLTELAMVTTSAWSDLGVIGAVVAVDADPGVFAQLDELTEAGKRCNPQEANDVVREIGELIDDIVDGADPADPADDLPVQNIVIVGADEMIPFARIPDGTTISNERSHGLTFTGNNETFGALLAGYYLSDDPYGADAGIAVNNHELFIPRRAVGRLVESEGDIAQALANFRGFGGLLDPSTGAVVSGYDFLADGSSLVASNLEEEGFTVTSLINETWSRQDLINLLTGDGVGPQDHAVASINAHFDESRALPADGNTAGDESDLFTIADLQAIDLSAAVLFSMGCHAGLSLSDVQVGSPAADWAETHGGMGNLWAANSGYGYGDTQIVALSETLTAAFADRLGSMTTGEAWMAAKQELAGNLFTIDPYHEKILQEFVFYGLPMYRTGPAGGGAAMAALPAPGGGARTGALDVPLPFSAAGIGAVTAFPAPGSGPPTAPDPIIPGLDTAVVNVVPDLERTGTPDGDYYHVDGGTLHVRGRPVQPLTGIDITLPDGSGGLEQVAAGALITGLTSLVEIPFDPLIFSPVVDIGDGSMPASTDAFRPEAGVATFPTAIQRITRFRDAEGQDRQRLLVVPGRLVSGEDGGDDAQILFTDITAEVFYRDAAVADYTAPLIREVRGAVGAGSARFRVRVDGEGPAGSDDTRRVFVLFRDAGTTAPTAWTGVDLARVPGTNTWTALHPLGGGGFSAEFIVQAVDVNGNVALANSKGVNYGAALDETPPHVVASVSPAPVNGFHLPGAVLTLTATDEGSGVEFIDYEVQGDDLGDTVEADVVHIDVFSTATFEFGATDFAGNESERETFTISVDTTPPDAELTVNGAPNTGAWYGVPAEIEITATDQGAGVRSVSYSLDYGDSWTHVPGDRAVLPTQTETVTVLFYATDHLGNRPFGEGPINAEETVLVDLVPPTVTIFEPEDGADYEIGSTVIADYDCDDTSESESSDSGVVACIGDVPVDDPVDTAALGDHTFTVVATDAAGNETVGAATYEVVDTISPSISIFAPLPVTSETTYDLNEVVAADYSCSDATEGGPGSGIASCVGDAADGTPFDTSTPGPNTFTVTATDNAGNESSTTVTYYVAGEEDTTPPEVTIESPLDFDVYEVGDVVLAAYSCDDPGGSGVASCVGDVPIGNAVDTATIGEKTFEVTGTDNAGNVAVAAVVYDVVDSVAPVVDIVSPGEFAVYPVDAAVLADYSCSDPGGSGVASCVGAVVSGAAIDTSTTGEHFFTVTGTDNAGNVTVQVVTYYVGVVPPAVDVPQVTIVAPVHGAFYYVGEIVPADYHCSAGDGPPIVACLGMVPLGVPIFTGAPGVFPFHVTAIDAIGEPHHEIVFYEVALPE